MTWRSEDTNVVRVRPDGFAVAVGTGATRIVATSGTASGASDLTVVARVAAVTVTPGAASGAVGDSAQFLAIGYDADGVEVADRPIAWSSTDPAVVVVSADGMGRAVGPGSASLVATIDGVEGTSTITVNAPPPPTVATVIVTPGSAAGDVGDSAQFSAAAQDSSGATIEGREVTWSSTNTDVVVVGANGMGRAVGAGNASLVATIDGVSGSSAITVFAAPPPPPPPPPPPAPVASVTIAPTNPSMSVGSGVQLDATLRDAEGNVLTGRSVTWSSENFLIATVGTNGYVTGVLPGSASITATSEGASGATTVTVAALPPPPPSGDWPNQPSTYSLLSDQPFSPSVVPGWGEVWDTADLGNITNNATAPFSASSVYELTYPAGFAAGTAPATMWYPLGGKRNLYVGMWWKANSGWQGHESAVNKIQFVFTSGTGGNLYMGAYGPPGGPYDLRILLQFNGGDTRSWLVANVGNGNVTMGDWHRIEWLLEYNTPGNGVVKWWLDGQLVGDYRDVTFPSTGFEEYKLSPTWGGVGGPNKQQTDYFWFDHVRLSHR